MTDKEAFMRAMKQEIDGLQKMFDEQIARAIATLDCDEDICECAYCLVPPRAPVSTIPEIPLAPAIPSFWVPTPPEEPAELTPIPRIRKRNCYVCGQRDAVARAKDEPAYCEEHRKR